MCSNELFCWLQSTKSTGFAGAVANWGCVSHTHTRRPESGKGSGRNSTEYTTEKIALLAPMPSASASTAMAVKPGDLKSTRDAYLRSCIGPLKLDSLTWLKWAHRRETETSGDTQGMQQRSAYSLRR